MKHLYFVRHGLSEANKASVWAGKHTETPLSPEGVAQAHEAGKLARELHIDHIISSPQSRAHDTAIIIAKEIGFPIHRIEPNSLFVERGFGVLEGTPWMPDLNIDGFADVETVDDLHHRGHLAYEHLLTLRADNILIVSHGALGRSLRHIIHTMHPNSQFRSLEQFPNGEIVQLL